MGNLTAYCLALSGTVPMEKQREFEQTFRLVSGLIPSDCMQVSFSMDIQKPDMYHFFSLWETEESLTSFCKSREFITLIGAYKTLGMLGKSLRGQLINIQAADTGKPGYFRE